MAAGPEPRRTRLVLAIALGLGFGLVITNAVLRRDGTAWAAAVLWGSLWGSVVLFAVADPGPPLLRRRRMPRALADLPREDRKLVIRSVCTGTLPERADLFGPTSVTAQACLVTPYLRAQFIVATFWIAVIAVLFVGGFIRADLDQALRALPALVLPSMLLAGALLRRLYRDRARRCLSALDALAWSGPGA